MGPHDNKAGTMVIGYNAILQWLAESTHSVSALLFLNMLLKSTALATCQSL